MKKQWNRILALLLSIFMVAAMFPAAAAEELLPESVAEETDSGVPDDPGETLPVDGLPPAEEGDVVAAPPSEDPSAPPQEEGNEPTADSDGADVPLPEEEDTQTPIADAPVAPSTDTPVFSSDEASYEYVLDTDGIDSGAVYAIVFSGTSENRVLYHKDESTTSDQVTPTLIDNKMIPDSKFNTSCQLWLVTKDENGGYVLQSQSGANNIYLDLTNTTDSKVNVSSTPQTLNITAADGIDGAYQISQNVGETTHYVRHPDNGQQFYTKTEDGTDYASFYFYKQTNSSTVEPEPDETDPLAIPGYTRVTSTELDSSKYYIIVSQDSSGNLYALYPAVGSISSGAVDKMENGLYVAELNTSGPTLSATYLCDNTTIENMAAFQFIPEQSGSGYTFYNRVSKLYLNVADSGMFSAIAVPLTVSASNGVYTIKNSGARRVLDFNKNGDSQSGSFKNMTTNFWGPRDALFSLYLYTLDGVTVEPELPAEPEVTPPEELTIYEYQLTSGEIKPGIYMLAGTTHEGKNSSSVRIMHLWYNANNQLRVDQCQSGDKQGTAATLPCSCEAHLIQIDAVEGGYTFRVAAGNAQGKYLAAVGSTLSLSDTATVFAITPLDGGGYNISCNDGAYLVWNSSFTVGSDAYKLNLYKQTEVAPQMAPTHFSGVSSEGPLVRSDTGSYFRIPSLYTLDNGWIMASSDIRWRGTGDNPSNIDTIVSISRDNGKTWEWEVVNYFADHAATSSGSSSAAFIDPSFVQSSDGTVWMAVDATPAYGGLMGGNRMIPVSSDANRGFDAQGRMLVGYITDVTDSAYHPENGGYTYDYYVDINNPSAGKEYTVNEESVKLWPICAQKDDTETGYYVDAFANTYYDHGEEKGGIKPVLTQQMGSSELIHNNLFYLQSEWKVPCTFYLMIRSAKIVGNHLEWSDPIFANVKNLHGEGDRPNVSNERFVGVCPGRGVVATVNGIERIIFPLYDNASNEIASIMYSDDGGATWLRGGHADQLNGIGKSSESQIVVLPNGDLRMYSRNTINYLGYTDSSDGGLTWSPYTIDYDLYSRNPGNGCMMSFINVEGYVIGPDNEVYTNLIMASYPYYQRSLGVIRIGYMDENEAGYPVHWLDSEDYRLTQNDAFIYSCLTQLRNADGSYRNEVSILPELDLADNTGLPYLPIDFDELLNDGWYFVMEVPEIPAVTVSTDLVDLDVGETVTVTTQANTAALVWTSGDETVATAANGVITAVAPGKTTVTVSATLNGITREAVIEVVVQDGESVILPDKFSSELTANTVVPAYTNYELATGGLESGAVYAVFDPASGGRRILYHGSGKSTTDQWGGSVSNGLLNLGGAKETAVLWTVTQNEDGSYTLCSLDDGKYLNYGSSGAHNHVPVTTAAHAFTIIPLGEGNYTVSWETNGETIYLDWNGKWGAGTSAYPLQFFQKVDYAESNSYTATADGLLALIADAEADVADYEDVLSLAVTYPTEDEARAAQTQINAAARALYAALRTPGEDPEPDTPPANPDPPTPPTSPVTPVTPVVPAEPDEPEEDDITDNDTPLANLPFLDVPATAWYASAVGYVQERALMQGLDSETFAPTLVLDRGSMVQLLFNLAERPDVIAVNPFSDVDSGASYSTAVTWAVSRNVVNGYGNGEFGPADGITREQMAVMLYRYAKQIGLDVSVSAEALQTFQDKDSISDWAVEAMTWAVSSRLIIGRDGEILDPQASATRAEAATVIMRFCENLKYV